MDTISQDIREYEKSADLLEGRINQLNNKITRAPDSLAAVLNKRRYTLYTMLWELQDGIREMKEYAKNGGCGRPLIQVSIPKPARTVGAEVSVGLDRRVSAVSI